eukprot:2626008-Rhodomonas_salina.5
MRRMAEGSCSSGLPPPLDAQHSGREIIVRRQCTRGVWVSSRRERVWRSVGRANCSAALESIVLQHWE